MSLGVTRHIDLVVVVYEGDGKVVGKVVQR